VVILCGINHRRAGFLSALPVSASQVRCQYYFHIQVGEVTRPKNETARNAVEIPVMNQAALRAVQIVTSIRSRFPNALAFLSAVRIYILL